MSFYCSLRDFMLMLGSYMQRVSVDKAEGTIVSVSELFAHYYTQLGFSRLTSLLIFFSGRIFLFHRIFYFFASRFCFLSWMNCQQGESYVLGLVEGRGQYQEGIKVLCIDVLLKYVILFQIRLSIQICNLFYLLLLENQVLLSGWRKSRDQLFIHVHGVIKHRNFIYVIQISLILRISIYIYIKMLGVNQNSQLKKQNRFYLRFHNSISRAIELNQQIFGDKIGKDGKEPCFQHSLRVAGHCEEILDQTMEQYHMGWLLGILHDNKQQNPLLFSQKIGWVMQDLTAKQQQKLLRYIDELTSNKTLTKGQQKREQLQKIAKMDLVPSWILLFDKYDNCRRFKQNACGKSKEELNGYYAVAYLIYLKARERHKAIREQIPNSIKYFYDLMGKELGGESEARMWAQRYFKMFD